MAPAAASVNYSYWESWLRRVLYPDFECARDKAALAALATAQNGHKLSTVRTTAAGFVLEVGGIFTSLVAFVFSCEPGKKFTAWRKLHRSQPIEDLSLHAPNPVGLL
jgi:hypothetical protein